jgi:fatty acid-binding protein DegV
VQVGVMHAVCEDDARYLTEQLRATLSPEVLMLSEISPATGVHTGPGTLGICWYAP